MMPRRFPTDPRKTPEADATPGVAAPDETTRRYSSHALADIRSAIAQAHGGVADDGVPAAPSPPRVAPAAATSWSAALPPMAANEAAAAAEVTQRYADRSVAGIRAAIAAAREAENQGVPRAAARFAADTTPDVKVPSLLLEARPVKDDDSDGETP